MAVEHCSGCGCAIPTIKVGIDPVPRLLCEDCFWNDFYDIGQPDDRDDDDDSDSDLWVEDMGGES